MLVGRLDSDAINSHTEVAGEERRKGEIKQGF